MGVMEQAEREQAEQARWVLEQTRRKVEGPNWWGYGVRQAPGRRCVVQWISYLAPQGSARSVHLCSDAAFSLYGGEGGVLATIPNPANGGVCPCGCGGGPDVSFGPVTVNDRLGRQAVLAMLDKALETLGAEEEAVPERRAREADLAVAGD